MSASHYGLAAIESRRFAHLARDRRGALAYAGVAFMIFGEMVYGELSRQAEELVVPACAVNSNDRGRHG